MSQKTFELEECIGSIDSPWKIDHNKALESVPPQYTPPETEPVTDPETDSNSFYRQKLEVVRDQIHPLQKKFIANKEFSILLVFQALDAAGKDGAIREVLKGLDVGGIKVASFKRPSTTELAHDFLWRTTCQLPERGQIGAFNRSYYEEVLTVRVHPEFLNGQYAGNPPNHEQLWPARYRAIREFEKHLCVSNTVVLKFWLNVSPQRQAMRFLDRLEDTERRWKFSKKDLVESGFRNEYDDAVRHMLNETACPYAPWFCVPADNRWYLRWQIAEVLLQALQALPMKFPEPEIMDPEEYKITRNMLRERAGTELT
jgi:PPK2 family polyphosphate:nucleotide phosphotransferase